ncbi:MAG: hypothetical protein IPI46_12155 [Bacteroidetes bacterium]|nr:hypothetical protein [Bacteroidota bacterium]
MRSKDRFSLQAKKVLCRQIILVRFVRHNKNLFKFQRNIAFLILVFFLFAQGLNLLVGISSNYHKQEVRSKIHKRNDLISLSFTKDEWRKIHFIKHDEIEVQGSMFDIRDIQILKDKVVIVGHFDTKDDNLQALSKAGYKNEKEQSKQYSFFMSLYFEGQSEFTYRVFFNEQKHFQTIEVQLMASKQAIESPPPEFV